MTGVTARRDFFISHAGNDNDWAEWVGQTLTQANYTVELDVWEWSAGTDFIASMERALEHAGRVLAIWTPNYFGLS